MARKKQDNSMVPLYMRNDPKHLPVSITIQSPSGHEQVLAVDKATGKEITRIHVYRFRRGQSTMVYADDYDAIAGRRHIKGGVPYLVFGDAATDDAPLSPMEEVDKLAKTFDRLRAKMSEAGIVFDEEEEETPKSGKVQCATCGRIRDAGVDVCPECGKR